MQSEASIIDCYRQDFIEKLRAQRNEKGISAREMSVALGQNVNYINLIENGKRLPSMQGFFAICDYLHLAHGAFFAPAPEGQAADENVLFSALTRTQKESIISLIRAFKS